MFKATTHPRRPRPLTTHRGQTKVPSSSGRGGGGGGGGGGAKTRTTQIMTSLVSLVNVSFTKSGTDPKSWICQPVYIISYDAYRYNSHQDHTIEDNTSSSQYSSSQSVQFSSKWYLCAREGPRALHPVSQEFPPMLPLKQFQCWSDWMTMTLSQSPQLKEDRWVLPSFYASLPPPRDGWCGVLGFVPAVGSTCLKLLNTSDRPARRSPLVVVAFSRQCICYSLEMYLSIYLEM